MFCMTFCKFLARKMVPNRDQKIGPDSWPEKWYRILAPIPGQKNGPKSRLSFQAGGDSFHWPSENPNAEDSKANVRRMCWNLVSGHGKLQPLHIPRLDAWHTAPHVPADSRPTTLPLGSHFTRHMNVHHDYAWAYAWASRNLSKHVGVIRPGHDRTPRAAFPKQREFETLLLRQAIHSRAFATRSLCCTIKSLTYYICNAYFNFS